MTLPWEKRKRRCGNCRYWVVPESPYFGECSATLKHNPFMAAPQVEIVATKERLPRYPLQTAEFHVCGMWWKKEALP